MALLTVVMAPTTREASAVSGAFIFVSISFMKCWKGWVSRVKSFW